MPEKRGICSERPLWRSAYRESAARGARHGTPQRAFPTARPSSRRAFLKSTLAAGAAPWFVPARALGRAGEPAPSGKITLGVLGVGDQGKWDLRAFLNHADVRVTTICDINQRNIAAARRLVAETYGSPDVKIVADFRELCGDSSLDAV